MANSIPPVLKSGHQVTPLETGAFMVALGRIIMKQKCSPESALVPANAAHAVTVMKSYGVTRAVSKELWKEVCAL